jgi:hypothetical protein
MLEKTVTAKLGCAAQKNAIIYYSWRRNRKKRQVNLFSSRYKRKSVIRRAGDAFRKLPPLLKQLVLSPRNTYRMPSRFVCASVVGFIHKGGDCALPWEPYLFCIGLCARVSLKNSYLFAEYVYMWDTHFALLREAQLH